MRWWMPPPTIAMPAIEADAELITFPFDGQGSWAIDPWEDAVGHLQGTPWISETGNIVLGGHSEMPNGAPGIFYHLDKLEVGDAIVVTTAFGKQRTFYVEEIFSVQFDDLTVLYPSQGPQLTLLTCDIPSFDPTTQFYAERLIVVARP